jgi:hypothetical protein
MLETLHLVGDSRLGHVQLVGGAREMPMARDRLKVAKLTKIHLESRSIISHLCVAALNLSATLSHMRNPDHHRVVSWMSEIRLSLAGGSDRGALERLAILDERALPPAPHLLATRDGEPCAAMSLVTGEVVADPFRRTAEVIELLRCHAAVSG